MKLIEVLDEFRGNTVKDAKSLLKVFKKVDTGVLYDSIRSSIVQSKGLVEFVDVEFYYVDYGFTVDQGRLPDNKMPPADAIETWMNNKKIPFSSTSLWAIRKHIAVNGIKPTFFYTKSINDNEKVLDKALDQTEVLYLNPDINYILDFLDNELK